MYSDEFLLNFVRESWKIEGLPLTESEAHDIAEFHRLWLQADNVCVASLHAAAERFTGKKMILRERFGMDVRVGNHVPQRGGPLVRDLLNDLLVEPDRFHPYVLHQKFEHLHPFMDGNGRTGRLLWLWAMHNRGMGTYKGFLHTWYYQSLEFYDITKMS